MALHSSDSPSCPPDVLVRRGAIVAALLVLLYGGSLVARARRAADWRIDLPIHPAARTAVVHRDRRLVGFASWRYEAAAEPADLRRFYALELPRRGWAPAGGDRWTRGPMTLALGLQPGEDGRQVALVLTRAR